jgi:hypothetical protein
VYRVTSASGFGSVGSMGYTQWLVFDAETQEVGGVWKDGNYLEGVWMGGTNSLFTLDNSYYGDWVYIQLPEPIILSSCSFTARAANLNRCPSKFRIYGSNNGASWSVLYDQTSPLVYSGTKASVAVPSTDSYTYIALVVSAMPAGGSWGTVLNFVKWKIVGKVHFRHAVSCLF